MNEQTESTVRLIQAASTSIAVVIVLPVLFVLGVDIPTAYWAVVGVLAMVYDLKLTAKYVKKAAAFSLLRKETKK